MASLPPPEAARELAQKALQANKDHQYALKIYTERLEAELDAVDKLLAASELPEEDLDIDAGGTIVVPNAVKATGLIPYDRSLEVRADPFGVFVKLKRYGSTQDHPFAEDAEKRRQYFQATVVHQMKAPELETLAEAVRAENYRIYALDAQRRGQPVFFDPETEPIPFLSTNKVGIDWERVASKVSAAGSSNVRRTAQECEIRWLGDRHPELNHSPWSQDEIARVKELVGDAAQGQVDWVHVATRLGTHRTPVDCMRHAILRRTHTWSPASDKRLLEAVQRYGTGSWLLVARYVSEDATASQCQARYTRSLDPSNRRGLWTEAEDAQLRRAVEVFGRSWVEVCTFVPTRSSEQCRDRWQEVLNPSCGRGRWSEDEDKLLLAAYATVGEGRWKEISNLLGTGRTDNMRQQAKAASKLASTSVPASPAPASDPSRTTAPSHNPQPVAGPSTQQEKDVGLPIVSQAAESILHELENPGTALSTEQEPDVAATPKRKPRPKPRPRRRAASTEMISTNADPQAPTSATDATIEAEQPVAESTSHTEQITEADGVQPEPKRRGRPRKPLKRPAENPEETGPPAKKSRKTNHVIEKSTATPSISAITDLAEPAAGPQTVSTSAEASRRNKGNNHRRSARTVAEPTRRSTRNRGRNQSGEDEDGDVPDPEAAVDVDMAEGSANHAHEAQASNEDPQVHVGQSQIVEPEGPAVQASHVSRSTGNRRGRGRGKAVPATTRTLRSSRKAGQ
ncbi:hypothetical protein EIP86_001048 [Pleurotus ostreatoroseus]|nr:hypothetical protein EIP86_001048 [Pleurotus ostreatoroseus]